MSSTRTFLTRLLIPVFLCAAAFGLWLLHIRAWDLGGRSPVLSYDAAQYAVAGRELAETGRLATLYALPIELERNPRPPWPLAVLQPGLVVWEALLFKLVPEEFWFRGAMFHRMARPDQRAWLALVLPFLCYLGIGALIARAVWRILELNAPALPIGFRVAGALVAGLAFALDPEAQHFGAGGFTELPFTLGLLVALAALAIGGATGYPLVFGLALGFTGAFRANMLWYAPLFAWGAAALAAPDRRLGTFLQVLLGYAIPLAPWWIYKTMTFGNPLWDLSAFTVWDGVQGRSWFSLFHQPGLPELPQGRQAAGLLGRKFADNLPDVLLAMSVGPRALWAGALLIAVPLHWKRHRAVAVTAIVVLGMAALSVVVGALGIPLLRYLFPARVLLEAAGLVATWAVLARAPLSAGVRTAAWALIAVIALGWGGIQTSRGLNEARLTSAERGLPRTLTMLEMTVLLYRQVKPGEPIMSNLGPTLAWTARRPVVHLALTPDAIEACRRKLDFRHVLLVFRSPERAWPGWSDVVEHPERAQRNPEWNIERVRKWRSPDGFDIVWLELGPLAPSLAAR